MFHPDIILLDIGMPRMNGFETVRQIRAETWGMAVTLVALTGWASELDRKRSVEADLIDTLSTCNLDQLQEIADARKAALAAAGST